MKLAASGSRGVYWKSNLRGTQELTLGDGKRPPKSDPRRGQRGDWWIRWTCPHGHLHRELTGPKSLAKEEAERKRLERPCPKHRPRPASYLLGDVITEYLEATRYQKRSHRDDKRYGRAWAERFGSRTLEDVQPGEIEKIRAERLPSVGPATVNRECAFLKRVYSLAIRDGKTERNPVAKLKMLREPSGRVRYLTDEEEGRLMAALPSEAERQRVTVLLQTGLRKSEFLGLRWKDADLRAGVLTIARAKNGEARHVPMTSDVRSIFSRLPRPLDGSALVFPNTVGTRDYRWAKKAFQAAVRTAQIDDFRFHDLRHTFASRLAMEAVDLLAIKDLGGWKSLAMVQRYAHLSPAHRREAIERLVTRVKATEAAPATGSE